MPSSPTGGTLPRTVVFEHKPSDPDSAGTKLIRVGNGSSPGITFTQEDRAQGTIEAVRIPSGGVQGARCQVDVRFEVRAGQNPGRIASTVADYEDE